MSYEGSGDEENNENISINNRNNSNDYDVASNDLDFFEQDFIEEPRDNF